MECVRLLQSLRQQTLDILESIRRWRRTSFDPTRVFVFPEGQNFLLHIITELNFVDKHERVIALLQHRMLNNPLITYDSLLCPNPFATVDQEEDRQLHPNPLNTINPPDVLKIRECETMLLEECKRCEMILPPPSPRRLMQWAKAPLSSLPPQNEMEALKKEFDGQEQRLVKLQLTIEKEDAQVLELQRLLQPWKRQRLPILDKMAIIRRKIIFAGINHNDAKLARLNATLEFWSFQLEHVDMQIKVCMYEYDACKMCAVGEGYRDLSHVVPTTHVHI